jgi:NADPH2 dehydrogenase
MMQEGTSTFQESTPTLRSKGGRRCVSIVWNSLHPSHTGDHWQITDAVHANGSYIFLQLWALGRAAEPDVLTKQDPPSPYVSASPIALTGNQVTPRALTEAEIEEYIAAYAKAASNAVHRAGFDGVEVHNANGYLPDQFLQSVSNTRTDKWGGDEAGRTRFSREIVDAVVDAVGEERVGIRISPWSTYQG